MYLVTIQLSRVRSSAVFPWDPTEVLGKPRLQTCASTFFMSMPYFDLEFAAVVHQLGARYTCNRGVVVVMGTLHQWTPFSKSVRSTKYMPSH